MQAYFQITVISRFILEKNAFKTLDKVNLNLIDCNLDNLDNNFEYLFLTSLLAIYSVD